MVALMVAILSTWQEPDLAQKVTLECRAMRAAVLVKQLESKTGIPFRTSPETAEQILVVKVKDVLLGTLMNRISSVTSARWVQEKQYVVLKRPADVERRQRQEYLTERAELIKRAVDKLYESSEAAKTLDSATAEKLLESRKVVARRQEETNRGVDHNTMMRLNHRLPFGRAIARLAKGVDPLALAALPPSSKIVFSPTPTRQQFVALGGELVLSKLASEHAAVIEAAGSIPGGFGTLPYYSWGAPTWHTQSFEKQPRKLLLIASTKGEALGSIMLNLEVADDTGRVIYTGSVPLSDYGTLKPVAGNQKPAWFDPSTPVEQSTLSQKLGRLFTSVSLQQPEPFTPPEDLLTALTRPEENDPLSFHATDVLLTLSKAKDANLVACLPDTSFNVIHSTVRKKQPTLGDVWPMLTSYASVDVDYTAGWVTAKSRTPWLARQTAVTRSALGDYAKAVHQAGYETLDAHAALHRSYRDTDFMSLPKRYASLLSFYIGDDPTSDEDGRLSRFVGSLPPAQWRQLHESGILDGSTLSGAALSALTELIHNRRLNLVQPLQGGHRSFHTGFLVCEPSESVAQATLLACQITLKRSQTPMAFSQVPGYRSFLAMNAQGVALQLFQKEQQERDPQMIVIEDSFVLGKADKLLFEFAFPGNLVWAGTLTDRQFDPRAKPQKLESLPETFRDAVLTELRRLRGRSG